VKIVFLNPSGALGGAETALLEIIAAVREARPSWALDLIASSDGPLLERADRLGARPALLKFPASLARLGEWGSRGSMAGRARFAASTAAAMPAALRYRSRLRQRLDAIAPHIVHTNGLKMHLLGAAACPSQARLVWHLHDYPGSRPLTAALLRAKLHRCDQLITNSVSVAEDARRVLPNARRSQTVYNAVDLERFRPDGPVLDLDALANLPRLAENGVRVGLVATFARWKGHAVFLRALSELKTSVPFRAYIIGAPIYETAASQFSMRELQDIANAFGLEDAVGFTGRIDDIPAALRALDVVVHASTEPEPFGLVIAEAMACGRALVVSQAGGAAEIAESGALFHEPGDANGLRRTIVELIESRDRRTALGAAGRTAALAIFSRERLSSSLLPVYESLVSAS
jgi:glycosyltransferase involved in cell wall biosynthesis